MCSAEPRYRKSEMFGQTLVRYLAVDGRGVFEFAQQSGNGAVVAKDAPNYVMVPLADGTTWSSTWPAPGMPANVAADRQALTAVNGTVIVPARNFCRLSPAPDPPAGPTSISPALPATVEVRGNEWYAPEVGFIKGAFRETVGNAASPARTRHGFGELHRAALSGFARNRGSRVPVCTSSLESAPSRPGTW